MDSQMYHYATVSKALEELAAKGFTIDFNLHDEAITKNPENFEIVHIYRYEGITDPGDEATVFGLRCKTTGEKGVYVAGMNAFADNEAAKTLLDISIKGRLKDLGQ